MIGPQIFQVLTEFRFEVGSAVANSKTLQTAVQDISTAANDTLLSFQRLGVGLVAQMGLGSGSLLGILGAAIQSSDKFGQSQRAFANIISSNMAHLTGSIGTFEDRMRSSELIMGNINKLADEFALPSEDLLNMSKIMTATLVPLGLAGKNFSTAIDISRGFLKSAPTLGIDTTLAQGQLTDLIMGHGSMQGQFTQRLVQDTAAFAPFREQGNLKKFNLLPDAERVKVVSSALKQFATDMDVLKGNALSLSGEVRRLTESLKGTFSIFKPLGDVLLVPLLKLLHEFNNQLRTAGADIIKSLSRFIAPFIKDPQELLINILQLRRLEQDTKLAGTGLWIIGVLSGVAAALRFLGLQATATTLAVRGLSAMMGLIGTAFSTVFGWLGRFLVWATGASSVFGAVFSIMNGLVVVASRIFVPFALLLGLFQLISRARAIADVEDAKAMITLAPALTEAFARLKSVMGVFLQPFADIFDKLATWISPLFRISYYVEILTDMLTFLADVLMLAQAGFNGILFAIFEFVNQVSELITGGGFDFAKIGEAFNGGIDNMIERNLTAINNGTGAVVQQTTNIGKVEIRNDFKEQMEPDRIAFTMRDQLLKAANNPGQTSGRSLRGMQATR